MLPLAVWSHRCHLALFCLRWQGAYSNFASSDYNCLFTNKGVIIFRRSDGSFAFKGVLREKLYLVDFIPEEVELDKCLIATKNMGWLWHHGIAHVGMRNLHKL
jgi:hypothetical protein